MVRLLFEGKWIDVKETKDTMMSLVELMDKGKLKDRDIELEGVESLLPYIIMYSKSKRLKQVI